MKKNYEDELFEEMKEYLKPVSQQLTQEMTHKLNFKQIAGLALMTNEEQEEMKIKDSLGPEFIMPTDKI